MSAIFTLSIKIYSAPLQGPRPQAIRLLGANKAKAGGCKISSCVGGENVNVPSDAIE